MKQPQGLTNKIIFKDNIITKVSRKEIDYYLNRENEAKLYEYFLSLNNEVNFIIYPLDWGYDTENNFYSQFKYIDNTYTLLEKPDFSNHNLKLIKQLIDDYHQLNPTEIVKFEPRTYLDKFRQAIKVPFFDLTEFDDELNRIMDSYYHENKTCFSHNDLTAGNFLFLSENEIKLIDYEYSMTNHYLFDYGSFITESLNGVNEQEFIDLLQLNETERIELDKIMFYQLILWMNWCNYMYEVYGLEIYKTIAFAKYEYLKEWQKKK